MSIENMKIYKGDAFIKAVYLGEQKIKYNLKNEDIFRVRYIREHLAKSTMPNGAEDIVRTFVELEAIDTNGDNVARGKTVSVQPGYSVYGGTGDMNTFVDGNRSQYFSLSPQDKQWAWVQVDLGQVYELEAINTWHYPDNRKFKTKIEISDDGINWETIFNSEVDGEYPETTAGKTHMLISADWKWPAKGFRYVRDYLRDNNSGAYKFEKHWLELQVLDKNGYNFALNKDVSYSPELSPSSGTGEPLVIVDGNTNIVTARDYLQLLPSEDKWGYVEVDLGAVYKPHSIKRWHYNKANWSYRSKVMVSEDGVTWYRVFDTTFNGGYVDGADGHTVNTPYTDQSEYHPTGIRYIRDWIRNSNVDGYRNWVEIAAFDPNNVNLARGRDVSIMPGYSIIGGIKEEIVDGKTDRWVDLQPNNSKWAWVQVDLGRVYPDVRGLIIWHYFGDGRRYTSRVEVSQDGINWRKIYDTRIDGDYPESKDGKMHPLLPLDTTVPDKKWTYYPNYTYGSYATFYVELTDSALAAAMTTKLRSYLEHFGEGVAMSNQETSGADFTGTRYLIRVNGAQLNPYWDQLSDYQKEQIVDKWWQDYIGE